ncbi:hypothetical protein [Streptomyces sp. enrichment culture]|uniref:hypothetical protein n=1 Tax=Streptomyces sp. enrichment culture TaxID=1795815 RepID=UPI003F57B081
MKLAQRAIGIACGLGLALGGAVTLAPAASATPHNCFYRVLEAAPDVDATLVNDACEIGSAGDEGGFRLCYRILRDDYVPAAAAAGACRSAARR